MSLVNKDVPPGAVVGGVPIRRLDARTDEEKGAGGNVRRIT